MRVATGETTSPQRESLVQLINQSTTRVVVTERFDVAARECSANYSQATKHWHSSNDPEAADDDSAKEAWEAANCTSVASEAFQTEHDEWYAWVRKTLDALEITYLTVPYESYVADPTTTGNEIQAFAGLRS